MSIGTATVRIPGWPECTWPLGCRTSVREPGRLCSPHRALVLTLDHAYEYDPEGLGEVPAWRPCKRCREREPSHRHTPEEKAAASSWLAAEVAKVGQQPVDLGPSHTGAPHVYLQHGAKPTSVAAAEKARPKTGTQRWRVLRVVVDAGEEGVTDEEIMARIGLPLNTVRPRRLELVEQSLVIDSGDTRPTAGGSPAIVWLATLGAVTVLESEEASS